MDSISPNTATNVNTNSNNVPKRITIEDRDVLAHIFSFIPFDNGNWFNVMCTCILWNTVGRKTFDPSKTDALKFSINTNNLLCLKVLLQDQRIDPSAHDHYAIRIACQYGHLEQVRELLKYVDPSIDGHCPLRIAMLHGQVTVVNELLNDGRVDPSSRGNYAIQWASYYGHLEIVRKLLKDSRVDPSWGNSYAIQWASRNGHLEIVKELLKDSRVDPSVNNNFAAQWASKNGHSEVLKELCKDNRVVCPCK